MPPTTSAPNAEKVQRAREEVDKQGMQRSIDDRRANIKQIKAIDKTLYPMRVDIDTVLQKLHYETYFPMDQKVILDEQQVMITQEMDQTAHKLSVQNKNKKEHGDFQDGAEIQKLIDLQNNYYKVCMHQLVAITKSYNHFLPLVHKANIIAKELKKDVNFSTTIQPVVGSFDYRTNAQTEFVIRVENRELDYFYFWDPPKFLERLKLMTGLLEKYATGHTRPENNLNNDEEDPFWNKQEPIRFGSCEMKLFENNWSPNFKHNVQIRSIDGSQKLECSLNVQVKVCDEDGRDSYDVRDATGFDLKAAAHQGQDFYFKLQIDGAMDLPLNRSKEVQVTYCLEHEKRITDEFVTYKTMVVNGQNPRFNFAQVHKIERLTKKAVDDLLSATVSHYML